MIRINHKFLASLVVLLTVISTSNTFYAEDSSSSIDRTNDDSILSSVTYSEGTVVLEKILALPGLTNVGKVTPYIYRGAQPEGNGYKTLKEMGIKTVINFRSTESEKDEVEAAGMRSVEIPISMLSSIDREKVDNIVNIMADPRNQPVYVHCKLGQDRTGIVVAAYRLKKEGWTLEEAEAEMQEYGFNNLWQHLKLFLHDYADKLSWDNVEDKKELEHDEQLLTIYQNGLSRVITYLRQNPELFATDTRDERILNRDEKIAIWTTWATYLDYLLSLIGLVLNTMIMHLLAMIQFGEQHFEFRMVLIFLLIVIL